MSTWISERACAKVNLALHVLGRRDDGYHELDSVVAFADVADEIKIRPAKSTTLTVTGPFANIISVGPENIIFKALECATALCKAHNIALPPLEIHLEKNLVVAAGIGGGSADAAALLRAVFRLLDITPTETEVQNFATKIGADVPICFLQEPARMQGIGEIISTLTVNLPAAIVLINPAKPCSTQAVFQNLALFKGQKWKSAVEVDNAPDWRNDLTEPAIAAEPEIQTVLDALKAEPCFSAVRMSGSGATCFGLVANRATANAAAARLMVRNPTWWIKAASLL